ncbi:hypothetical protein ACHAPQ_011116 [Fusarium lateritium]
MGLTKERDLQENLIAVVAGNPIPKDPKPPVASVPVKNGKEPAELNETEHDDHKAFRSRRVDFAL